MSLTVNQVRRLVTAGSAIATTIDTARKKHHKTRTEPYTEWKILNNQKPIWKRHQTELEDYN